MAEPTVLPERGGAPRHHPLDLLRGLAALGITAYHWLASVGVVVESLGTFGVYLFFILSALTMTMVYGGTFSAYISARDLKAFYWNRLSRILPLLAAVSLASFLLAPHGAGVRLLAGQLITAFLTGTGFFALQLPGFLSNSEGAWSLGIELLFYLVFPALCLVTRATPARRLIWIALVAILAQQVSLALLHRWASEDPKRFWDYYSTPLTFVPFFLVGLWISRISLVRRKVYLLPTLAALAAIAGFSVFYPAAIFVSPGPYLVLTALAAIAVLAAYCSALPRGLIGVAAFLGNVSYALYLTHPFALRLSQATAERLGGGVVATAAMFFPLALVMAFLTFTLFERPAREYLRGLQGTGLSAPVASDPDEPTPAYQDASE